MEKNNQLAFDIAEKELGISPIMTGREMASVGEPDKLSMVMYLTQFYEMFKDSLPSRGKGPRGCWVAPRAPPPSDPFLCGCWQALLLIYLLLSAPVNVESMSIPVQSLVPFSPNQPL